MVVKPTELTPMTALVLADLLYEAGLPPEMLSVVTGWPQDIGLEMIQNPHAELITFTGGVPVGKMIADKAGYKRTRSEEHTSELQTLMRITYAVFCWKKEKKQQK